MILSRACEECGEWRCKKHCLCGRKKTITDGRKRSRGADEESERPSRETSRRVAVSNGSESEKTTVAPVGRPSALGFSILTIGVWWQKLMEEVGAASEIVLASFTYDHSSLTALLVRRLQGRASFSATILVDKESFEKRDAPHERPRLRALRDAGAQIYICRGSPPFGRMHMKALCIDRRTVFAGSANFTDKSSSNIEMVQRMVGPPVGETLRQLLDVQSRGKLWDGA